MSKSSNLKLHTLSFQVRDYECDLQGIVNNAVYFNYFEHARHEMLKSRGLNFVELVQQGLDLVLANISLSFKDSLRPGDYFRIETSCEREGRLKININQTVIRESDQKMLVAADVMVVCVDRNKPRPKPVFPQILVPLFIH